MSQKGPQMSRAEKANATVTETIPFLRARDPRAHYGSETSKLISYTNKDLSDPAPKPLGYPPSSSKLSFPIKVRVVNSDMVSFMREYEIATRSKRPMSRAGSASPNIGILNPASMSTPGGGFIRGCVALEEDLCMCSTLYASQRESFYPLPETGGMFTLDTLFFREGQSFPPDAARQGMFRDLDPSEYFYADVVSAAFIKDPEVTGNPQDLYTRYKRSQDRTAAEERIAGVMRIFEERGCEYVVLCFWGAGAYNNPISDVVEAFRRVLIDGHLWKNTGGVVKEVVFAIKSAPHAIHQAHTFARLFGHGVEVEELKDDRTRNLQTSSSAHVSQSHVSQGDSSTAQGVMVPSSTERDTQVIRSTFGLYNRFAETERTSTSTHFTPQPPSLTSTTGRPNLNEDSEVVETCMENDQEESPAEEDSEDSEESEKQEETNVRCVCDDRDENSPLLFVACESCNKWQHPVCVGIEADDVEDLPRFYFCEKCDPVSHRYLLRAIYVGEKPWIARRQAWEKKEARKGARALNAEKERAEKEKAEKRRAEKKKAEDSQAKSGWTPAVTHRHVAGLDASSDQTSGSPSRKRSCDKASPQKSRLGTSSAAKRIKVRAQDKGES